MDRNLRLSNIFVFHREIQGEEYSLIKIADFGFVRTRSGISDPVTKWCVVMHVEPIAALCLINSSSVFRLLFGLGKYIVYCGITRLAMVLLSRFIAPEQLPPELLSEVGHKAWISSSSDRMMRNRPVSPSTILGTFSKKLFA